ncbi:isocitrate lyase/phosphoenolpyruvate mutase family protein [Chitinophaga sp. G-6-1-13]|uniref:Isocitrate lyase/phosphoenolpyruvate mutase family protein n=1 Tax=Chitinophaga fulva TaxID=2728842 RepID=A0A848GMZ2_9BACT|nr:isocitrate lyase/phosphoenolpyruvate mutase family protein [Chitinophaga fulva]NML37318.1 isocitrate lyase/phosphoenolpyruvate mutase family protein [Chitinophaga fulva]
MSNTKPDQTQKADQFRALHHSDKLLLLPNVWDHVSTKLITKLNFPAIGTASIATAISNGYPDGEHIPFPRLLEVVRNITAAADYLPVTVDIERGFSGSINKLEENIAALIETGIVGINIEDSNVNHHDLLHIKKQCEKIATIRKVADDLGVRLFINARTDVYFNPDIKNPVEEVLIRAEAYADAGADCIYPILVKTYEEVEEIAEKSPLPINVLLIEPIRDLQRLQAAGVARVSLGPLLFSLALTKIRDSAAALKQHKTEDLFDGELLSYASLHDLL